MPEGGERGDFGVAFSADLTAEQLASLRPQGHRRARGNAVHRRPRRLRGHRRRERARPGASRLPRRWAFPGGPRRLARRHDRRGRRPARRAPPSPHDALRAALAPEGATSHAPRSSSALSAEVASRPRAGQETDAGPVGAFAGVVWAASRPERPPRRPAHGDGGRGRASLRDAAARAATVKELVEQRRRALAGDFGARLMGSGALIDGLSVDAANRGSRHRAVRTRAPTRGDVAEALERFWTRLPSRAVGALAPDAHVGPRVGLRVPLGRRSPERRRRARRSRRPRACRQGGRRQENRRRASRRVAPVPQATPIDSRASEIIRGSHNGEMSHGRRKRARDQ